MEIVSLLLLLMVRLLETTVACIMSVGGGVAFGGFWMKVVSLLVLLMAPLRVF